MSETSFKMFDFLPDVVCIVDNTDLKISHVNQVFEDLLMPASRCLGLNFCTDFVFKSTDQIKIKTICSLFNTNSLTQSSNSIGTISMISNLKVGDFPTPIKFHWMVKPFENKTLIFTGHKINNDDYLLSKQINNEEDDNDNSQLVTENEFIDYFQKAPISLHWLSGTGRVIWANDTELQSLGYTAEEYIGHHISEFCPDEPEMLQEVFERLGRGETIHDMTFRFRTKSNEIKVLLVDSNVNWNPDGSFRHTRCFIRDITESHIKHAVEKTEYLVTKQSSEAKDKFLQVVFHLLRTPLHVITSLFEEGLSIQHIHNPLYPLMKSAEDYVEILRELIEDVATVSMFERKLVPMLNYVPGKISTLLSDIIKKINDKELRAGQLITFDTQIKCNHTSTSASNDSNNKDDNEIVYSIPVLLERVLFHLIKNACSFSTDTAIVKCSIENIERKPLLKSLSTKDLYDVLRDEINYTTKTQVSVPSTNKKYLQISIVNTTNTIIKTEYLSKHFQSYHHIYSNDYMNKYNATPGLGLGLYISSHILECFGTNLEVHVDHNIDTNESIIEFSFTLSIDEYIANDVTQQAITSLTHLTVQDTTAPTTMEESKWIPIEENEIASNYFIPDSRYDSNISSQNQSTKPLLHGVPPIKSYRILIVDDSSICQKMLVKILEKHDYVTDIANNGQEACDKLSTIPCYFDAVFMDIRMPVMDGITATKYIRDILKLKVPIITVTAELDVTTRDAAINAGSNGFLNKPSKLKDVLDLLYLQFNH